MFKLVRHRLRARMRIRQSQRHRTTGLLGNGFHLEQLEQRFAPAVGLIHSLFPLNSAAGDQFGFAVAASDESVVIGAPGDNHGAGDSGSAYVFDAETGRLVTTLTNPTPAKDDLFGASVAISGNVAVVGAWQDDAGANSSGEAYVFNATTGALVAKLANPTPAEFDNFGFSVAVSGEVAVVGADRDDTDGTDSGRAYLFNTSTGALLATLNNPTPADGDLFGISVAISGTTVVVGSWQDDAGRTDSGQAYVFDAATGRLVATLANPTPAKSDHFGRSVAVSGNVVVVGANRDDTGATNSGQAYLFDATTGALIATLANPAPGVDDEFGFSVAISANTVIVGALGDDTGGDRSGQAYLFDATTGAMVATVANPTPANTDFFGYAVAASGNRIITGAPLDDTLRSNQGAAYVFSTCAPNPLVVTSAADDLINDCEITLREAIQFANGRVGPDTIQFLIPGGGVHTIRPTTLLPTVTDPLIIDGTSQPGYVGIPLIELDGNLLGGVPTDIPGEGNDGLRITAGNSTVRALAVNRFGDDGIEFRTGGGNVIERSMIGTDTTGTIDRGNLHTGIEISNSPNNRIGTDANGLNDSSERNVISGNGSHGIAIVGALSSGNIIAGNRIGTNFGGSAALGNGDTDSSSDDGVGVLIGDYSLQRVGTAHHNIIGGAIPAAQNIIAGNRTDGVLLTIGTFGNDIQGNRIGTDTTSAIDLGNLRHGIVVNLGAHDNSIRSNVIRFNGGDGVRIDDSGDPANGVSNRNRILSNSIANNGGLGIELAPSSGITANDLGDGDRGANNLQNFPQISSATSGLGRTAVSGTLNSTANSTFLVEFFANSSSDVSGSGEGERSLGTITVATGVSGDANFTTALSPQVASGQFITATATLLDANSIPVETSEFSQAFEVVIGTGTLEIKVVNAAVDDSGKFDLQIDHVTELDEASPGDSTGERIVNVGIHTVGETADGETSLTNYSTTISCRDQRTGSLVANSDSAGPLGVTIHENDDIVCTVTNRLIVPYLDFGDAPQGIAVGGVLRQYPTKLPDGPWHLVIVGGPFLGSMPGDGEDDGQPDEAANGDDIGGKHDENGAGASGIVRAPGDTIRIVHNGGSSGAQLSAWLDVNSDGDWDDPGEHVLDQAVPPGASTTPFTIPVATVIGPTFLRTRISTQSGLTPRGEAADGEVEDLLVMICQQEGPCHTLLSANPIAAASGDQFGSSVALAGSYLVVGAPQEDRGGSGAGSAYVFDLSSDAPTTPIALSYPSPGLPDFNENFGWSVAASGNYVVVGAPRDARNAGAAYLYDLSTETPGTPIATLNNPAPTGGGFFGSAVALADNNLVVGAPADDIPGAVNAGRAYVYDLSSTPPKLIATLNNPTPAAGDEFGISVAVAGNNIVVGAGRDNSGASDDDAGAAYVFDLSSITPNVPRYAMPNPTPNALDNFGLAVVVAGNHVVVAAPGDDTKFGNAGAVYLYDLSSATPTTPVTSLHGDAASAQLGKSLSAQGTSLIVGAPGAGTGGLAYAYLLSTAQPTLITTIKNPSPAGGDQFGFSVAVDDNYIAVGAPFDDTQDTNQGAAYVFHGFASDGPVVAEMNVQGNARFIADGDVAPTLDDHTDFGSALVADGTVVRTFTIENAGTAELKLTGNPRILVGGPDAQDFSVTVTPASPIVPSGATTFQIIFDPSRLGLRTATVTIANDDADENPYDFAIQGTGIVLQPEMNVQGNGVSIADGDVTPTVADHTDFGVMTESEGAVVHTFAIQNTGTSELTLANNPRMVISGPHTDDFTVIVEPASPVAADGSTTFQIAFDPSALGVRTATVTIANDDADESAYDFVIQGVGVASAPELIVLGNAVLIADGDLTPTPADHTDFGTAPETSGTVVRTFTVANVGTTELALTGNPRVVLSGANASDFKVTVDPTSPISAGGETTFQITFDPSELGLRKANVTIANEDDDESLFEFAIQGIGIAQSCSLVVDHTADDGLSGSLRSAIQCANDAAGVQTISFNIPATDPGHVYYRNDGIAGSVALANVTATTATDDTTISDIDPDWAHSWYTIRPITPLPTITSPVILDGNTQPLAVSNSNPVGQGLNTVLRIEINGEANDNFDDTSGPLRAGLLRFFGDTAGESTLRGLVLNRAGNPYGPVSLISLDDSKGNNVIEGSFLGTDVSGSIALSVSTPFGSSTGFIRIRSSDNVIGGLNPASRNLITSVGVEQLRNRIEGNLIGTDRTGSRGLGGGVGDSGIDTVIGGPDPASQNVIASVGRTVGVGLVGTRALLQNNLIGSDITGTIDAGGDDFGVVVGGNDNRVVQNSIAFFGRVEEAGTVNEFTVGGGIRVTGDRSVISQNSIFSNFGPGISVTGNRNFISQNSIFSNAGIGIDLVKEGDSATGGVTANDQPPDSDPPDQDTGPNLLQNFPILTAVTDLKPGTHIEGTLASSPDSKFVIEFFANSERDDASNGLVAEGQTLIGTVNVTTGSTGLATFSADFAVNLLTLPGIGGQPFVTATATDITDDGSGPRNNASEFSPVAPLGGFSFVVSSTADSGLGTLREAITNANFTTEAQTITFAIPPNDPRHVYYRDDGVSGQVTFENTTPTSATDDSSITDIDPDWPHSWFGLILDSELPNIIDTVTIDGYSQPGAKRNTLGFHQGLDTLLRIELDGRNVTGDGLTLASDATGSVIQGLAINAFEGNGIVASTFGGRNTIVGNFIGSDISGTLNFGNGGNGVFLVIETDSSVGGADAENRNLISGNIANGVLALSGSGGLIQGNIFGGDRQNKFVFVTPGAPVYITNNEELVPSLSAFTPLRQKTLARQADAGTDDKPFRLIDDEVSYLEANSEKFNFFMGTNGNVTDYSILFGRFEAFKITIRQIRDAKERIEKRIKSSESSSLANSETANASPIRFLGIDLGQDGVSPNDPGDLDDGPNGLQNYPLLNSATSTNTGTAVAGTLDSLADTSFRIELLSSSYDTSDFRAGEHSLGAVVVTTNGNGNASFTFVSQEIVPVGHHVIALATRLEDRDNDPATPMDPTETSEFSAGIVVQGESETTVATSMADELVVDIDGDSRADAGDTIRYTVVLSNTGNKDAAKVHYVEDLDPNASVVEGSVTTTQGTVVSGNFSLAVDVGTIPAASSVTVTFEVLVKDSLPASATQVSNQGIVAGSNFAAAMTDDPATPAVGDPTITRIEISLDFGDAPTAAQSGFGHDYPTVLPEGARHAASSLILGGKLDVESDGQPNGGADGDGNDDDGVQLSATLVATSASDTTSSLLVTASATGKLDAWIDFNHDGDWFDEREQLFATSLELVPGPNLVQIIVPAGASPGETYARFRLSSAGNLTPTGPAADGEVEDYRVTILDGDAGAAPTVNLSVGDVQVVSGENEVVVEAGQQLLLQTPDSSINGLTFMGTDGDNVIELNGPVRTGDSPGTISFDGVDGIDTLRLNGANQSLDLTDRTLNRLAHLELIQIAGVGPNHLILDEQSVVAVTDLNRTLRVQHNEDDTVDFQGIWIVEPKFVDNVFVHLLRRGIVEVLLLNTRPWRNPLNRFDTSLDGLVVPGDVLITINTLNAIGPRHLPAPTSDALPTFYYDVNGDGFVTPLDALQTINFLNGGEAEGESTASGAIATYIPPTCSLVDDVSASPTVATIIRSERSGTSSTSRLAIRPSASHDESSLEAISVLGREAPHHKNSCSDREWDELLGVLATDILRSSRLAAE